MFTSATAVPKSSWAVLATPSFNGGGHPKAGATDRTCASYIPFDNNLGHWIQIDLLGFRAVRGVILEHRGGNFMGRAATMEVRIGFLELTGTDKKVPYVCMPFQLAIGKVE